MRAAAARARHGRRPSPPLDPRAGPRRRAERRLRPRRARRRAAKRCAARRRATTRRSAAARSSCSRDALEAGPRRGARARSRTAARGRACARAPQRSRGRDLIRAIHDWAARYVHPGRPKPRRGRPSWRSAATAAACWRRAPTSICCSCCPTSRRRGRASIIEAMLYVLWDLKQKVGHATRSIDECLRQARADMTIRTTLLEARFIMGDEALFERCARASTRRSSPRRRANSSPPSSPSATRASSAPANRAISSSPTSRRARAACAISTRCSGSPNTSIACATPHELVAAGLFSQRELRAVLALRGVPVGGALPPAFPHRARRGAAELRPAARRSPNGSATPRAPARPTSSAS